MSEGLFKNLPTYSAFLYNYSKVQRLTKEKSTSLLVKIGK
jgi:hypothetical protein